MGMGPQSPLPEPSAGGHDKYVALVSGLGLGLDGGNPLQLALLVDFLTGLLGGRDDQARAAQVRTCPGADRCPVVPTLNHTLLLFNS